MLETFTKSTFNVREYFLVYLDGELIEDIELVDIVSGISTMPNAIREPFSLIFKGEKTGSLNQGCYQIEHKEIGKFELFLSPVMLQDKENQFSYYEACFS